MVAAKYIPDDWATMRQAVFAWARGVLDSSILVLWGEQNAPVAVLPRVVLRVISPPSGPRFADKRIGPALIVVKPTFAVGVPLVVDFPGVPSSASYTPILGDTISAARAGLAAALAGSPVAPVANYRADAIALHDPIDLEGRGFELSADLVTKLVQSRYADRRFTVSVDIHTDPLVGDPIPIAAALRASLEGDLVREALDLAGLAFLDRLNDRMPSQVIGSVWQGRAGFDLVFGCRERASERVDWIETFEVVGPTVSFSSTIGETEA